MTERPDDEGLACKQVVEILSDYLEDALTPDERARVEAHLQICEGCDTALAQLRETVKATGMLTEEQLPADLRDTLVEAFRDWQTR